MSQEDEDAHLFVLDEDEELDLPLELPRNTNKITHFKRNIVIVLAVLLVLFLVITGIASVIFSIVWAATSDNNNNHTKHSSSITPSPTTSVVTTSTPSPSPSSLVSQLPRFEFFWGTNHGNYQRTGYSSIVNNTGAPSWRINGDNTILDILPTSFGVLISTSQLTMNSIAIETGYELSSVRSSEANLQTFMSNIVVKLPNEQFDLIISIDALCRVGYFYVTEAGAEFQFSFVVPGVTISRGVFPYCNFISLDPSGFNVLVHFNIESVLILFDIETQSIIWKTNRALIMLNTPVTFAGNTLFAYTKAGDNFGVSSINPENGRLNWLTVINATHFSIGAANRAGDRFYFLASCENTSCQPVIYCLNTSGIILWSVELNTTNVNILDNPVILSNPVSYPVYDYLVLISINHDIYCFSPDGALLWLQSEAAGIAGITRDNAIVVLNGKIYSDNGTWISPFGDAFTIPIYSKQVIDANNNLFISSGELIYATHLHSLD